MSQPDDKRDADANAEAVIRHVSNRRDFVAKLGIPAVVAGGLAALSGALAGATLMRWTPTGTTTPCYANGIKNADYIIYISSSYYYAINGSTGVLDYGGPDNAGGVDGRKADAVIQAVVNALTAGGTIFLKAGIYNLTTTVSLPYGLSFYFIGNGIPSFPYPFGTSIITSTPTDGTQIRGPTSWLTNNKRNYMITRASGATAKGVLGLFNIGVMPPHGTMTEGSLIYGIYDKYSAIIIEDNLLFAPWGWAEAGCPSQTHALYSQYIAPTKNSGAEACGGGSEIRVGSLVELGMNSCSYFASVDNVSVDRIDMFRCYYGLQCKGVWQNYVREVLAYDHAQWAVRLASHTRGNHIRQVCVEPVDVSPLVPYVVELESDYARIDYVLVWNTAHSKVLTAITDNDANLEGQCLGFNLAGTGLLQTFPLSKLISNPFGGTISSPFKDTSPYAVGSGGSNVNPTSGRTYTCNEPVDVTISGGSGVSITTKDSAGNTIDNAVSSLSQRLLFNNYTLAVTYDRAPTVTIVQATIGLGGTTATPKASVNYLANGVALFITASGGSGLSATTYDGSSNTMGNVMDSGLTTLTRYKLQAGQIINLGNFSVAPTTLTVNRE